jgi:hypothetical protein
MRTANPVMNVLILAAKEDIVVSPGIREITINYKLLPFIVTESLVFIEF